MRKLVGKLLLAMIPGIGAAWLAACTPDATGGDSSPPPGEARAADPTDPLSAVPTPAPGQVSTGELGDPARTPDSLRDRAAALAASASDADLNRVGTALSDPAFLVRLDSLTEYQGTYHRLRLSQVIRPLAENPAPRARALLVGLTTSKEFPTHLLRVQLLIRALAHVRPAEPEVIGFWDRFSAKDSPLAHDVVEAIAINQSAPALRLLEQKFSDPSHPETLKKAWLRQIVLPRRNDVPLLESCERMLTLDLPVAIRICLVEVLFDYRSDWYVGDDPPHPPLPATASPQSRQIRARIGALALQQPWLDSEHRTMVRKALAKP